MPSPALSASGTALVDDRGRYERPHAAGLDHLGDRVGVVVHVDEGRRAAANHFPAGELGADADEFGVHESDLGRKDVVL